MPEGLALMDKGVSLMDTQEVCPWQRKNAFIDNSALSVACQALC